MLILLIISDMSGSFFFLFQSQLYSQHTQEKKIYVI